MKPSASNGGRRILEEDQATEPASVGALIGEERLQLRASATDRSLIQRWRLMLVRLKSLLFTSRV